MAKYHGGEIVKEGIYMEHSKWRLESIAKGGGSLPDNKQTRYSKLPTPALIVVVPLMGLVYALSVPTVYCLVFIFSLIRLGGMKVKAIGHSKLIDDMR